MDKPLIGILMATYNGEKFIKEQIESILDQTYKNWKLIIHDDGSTDSTVDMIKEYAKKHLYRIIFIDDGIKCGGAKENFAHLMQIAKDKFNFDYIMFSDQDDVWLPNKIEITLNKMLNVEHEVGKDKPILIHTDLKVVDEHLNVIAESFWKYQKINPRDNTLNRLLCQNVVTGCTVLINKPALDITLPIPDGAILHDWWIALVVATFGQIFYVPRATILYRQHLSNETGAKNWNFISIIKKIFKKKEIEEIKKNYLATIEQAKSFLKKYNNNLFSSHKEMLNAYIELPKFNSLTKLYYIQRYGFYKSGKLRNLGWIIFQGLKFF